MWGQKIGVCRMYLEEKMFKNTGAADSQIVIQQLFIK